MSQIGYAALSGLQTAQKVMDMIAHNVANAETPGYHRLEEHNKELGPFPVVAGVTTDITRSENTLLDNLMNSAINDKQKADTFKDAVTELERLPSQPLEESYNNLMAATHLLLRTPNDAVAQQDFNDKAEAFQTSVNNYRDTMGSIKGDIEQRMSLEQMRVDSLQQQLQDISSSGNGKPEDVNFIKMQLMQATGSIESYKKVLASVIPPIELAFNNATNFVQSSMNKLSGQTIFANDAVNRVKDFNTFNEKNLPEWDSQWYAGEIGKIKTSIGNLEQLAANGVVLADGNYNNVNAEHRAAFGVDLVEQQVKSMRYQRMYEANAQVIKTQDQMIGTLLSILQ